MIDNIDKLIEKLRPRISCTITDTELMAQAKIAHEINKLKREKKAVILAHNYMAPVLFSSIPDFVGDSLELSRKAATTDKDIIIFCGVKFMAETAKLLNPNKLVLLPSLDAGCSLAESITADNVRSLKKQFPGVPVVTYINTYADVKAESDICCTSGNAAAVVESLHADTIIFIPDEYMAKNIARVTHKHVIVPMLNDNETVSLEVDYVKPKDSMIIWNGKCEVHEKFSVDEINHARRKYPGVVILAHPECSPEITEAVDFVGGTTSMINYVEKHQASYYLLLTECAMAENIAALHPDKNILRIYSNRCPHMDRISLENTLFSLQKHRYQIEIHPEIQERARRAITKMLAVG